MSCGKLATPPAPPHRPCVGGKLSLICLLLVKAFVFSPLSLCLSFHLINLSVNILPDLSPATTEHVLYGSAPGSPECPARCCLSPPSLSFLLGGLFEYVTAANYLGEIVEWCGFALASWSPPGAAFALFSISTLLTRARQHHQ